MEAHPQVQRPSDRADAECGYAQKGFVVNYKMIKKLNKTGVELVNGENVPISRGMKNEFFANYFEFLGK